MNSISIPVDWYQLRYTMAGFDRLNFVNDITEVILQDETCQITRLSFDADGVQARGSLTIRTQQQQRFATIHSRLRTVKGMVSVLTDSG